LQLMTQSSSHRLLVKDTTWNLVAADSVIFFSDNSLTDTLGYAIVVYGDTLNKSFIPADPTKEGFVFNGWYYKTKTDKTNPTFAVSDGKYSDATALADGLYGVTKSVKTTGQIKTTIYAVPAWAMGVYAVLGEDTIPVAKLGTADFTKSGKATDENQVKDKRSG